MKKKEFPSIVMPLKIPNHSRVLVCVDPSFS